MPLESYNEAAKKIAIQMLEEYKLNCEALRQLRHKLQRLAASGAPASVKGTAYDGTKSSTAPYHPSMANIAAEYEKLLVKIAAKQAEIWQVESALGSISQGCNAENYSDILIMRHVDGYSMERIAAVMRYSSRQAVYNQYHKAMNKFIKAVGL